VRVQVIPFIGFFVSTTSVYKNEIKTRQDYYNFTFIISNHESRYYIFSRGFIIIFLILVIQLKLLLLLHSTEPYVRKTLFQMLRFVSKQLFQTCSWKWKHSRCCYLGVIFMEKNLTCSILLFSLHLYLSRPHLQITFFSFNYTFQNNEKTKHFLFIKSKRLTY
jgi:hypothetical protein